MARRTVETDALVLRRVAYQEADLVVHLLTREHGRIDAFARSARGSKRRFRGGLEVFTVVRAELAPRDEGLWAVSQTEAVAAWPEIGTDPARAGAAAVVAELIDSGYALHQGDAEAFDRAVRFLAWLASADHPPVRIEAAVLRMALIHLEHGGVMPDFARSARSARAVGQLPNPVFVADVGVIDQSEAWSGERTRRVTREVCGWLEQVAAGRFGEADSEVRAQAGELVVDLWQHYTQRELRSWSVYRALIDATNGRT